VHPSGGRLLASIDGAGADLGPLTKRSLIGAVEHVRLLADANRASDDGASGDPPPADGPERPRTIAHDGRRPVREA
jgi:hypothetical protein